jgi:hypothetical protein
MLKLLANLVTFLLFVALVVTAALALIDGQERTPLATDAERALAPLMVSTDGRTVTFRGTAINGLIVRVEPATGTFGRTVTFTVGDVRDGRWGLK